MTNFTRKFLDEFAKDNKGTDLTIYGSTASASPAPSSDPEVLQSNPKFREGWKGATLENLTNNTRNPVTNEWSALDYIHNYHINSILQKGGQDWNIQTEYYIGDIVKDAGTSIYYKSLTDNNIGNITTDIVNWQLLGDMADLVNISPAPANVVLVKQESDFGTPSGGIITLVNDTIYRVSGQVIMTSKLALPDRSRIKMGGGSYAGMDELVFVFGAGDAITASGQAGIFHIFDLNITDATGLSRFVNGIGDGSFTEQSIFIYTGGNIQNFGSFGDLAGYFTIVLRRLFCFETGKLTIDNAAALTANAFLWKNFTTKGLMFDLKTNISQAAFTEVSLLPAKSDIPFSVDPAMVSESGISITLFPYNGFVFVNAVNFADNGGGGTTINTAIGHSFDNSDYIFILSGTYAGVHQISNVTNKQPDGIWGSVGVFDIPAAFIGNDLTRPIVYLFNISTLARFSLPFYRIGVTGSIISIADNGSGFARVNSIAHGLTTGQSLFISNTDAYDAGYYAVVIDVDNFDLLDSFGQPVPFTTPETSGDWDTSGLDEKNNILAVQNTGGILPDSQTLGNAILTTTVAFPSTTTLVRVSIGTWFSDETQRFKSTSDGRLIYTGRTTATVSISAKVVVQRQSGTTATAFMNIMEKRVGQPSFVEITNHPSSQNQITSSNAAQLTVAAIVDQINPGDEFGIGIATDSALTLDIFSIDFNIKK